MKTAIFQEKPLNFPKTQVDGKAIKPITQVLLERRATPRFKTEPVPDESFVTLNSDGVTLLYGKDETAVEAAQLLKDHLDLTVLIKQPSGVAPLRARVNSRRSQSREAFTARWRIVVRGPG